jgi:hypothetical protein
MDIDAMKTFGYGEHPDWRWRSVMGNFDHIRDADTPAEYFTGPGEEALLEDEMLAEVVFPYMKWYYNPEFDTGMPEEHLNAIMLATGAGSEWYITPDNGSLLLEVGVLGRRAQGDLLVEPGEYTPLVQTVYERLFFDVRPFLDDAATTCRLILHNRKRLYSHNGYGLVCKMMAYALGFDEYHLWREGSPSEKAKTLHSAINAVLRFLGGLQLLGIDKHDDMEKAFIHFFSFLPEILARDTSEARGEHGYHDYTSDEMKAITEMLPKIESVAV